LKKYVDDAEYPKLLRPESAEARKSVIRCMRDELKDMKAGDINLSDEESDQWLVTMAQASWCPQYTVFKGVLAT